MIVGIYKITSPSNRVYIGQSVNIENRFRKYKHTCYNQTRLLNSFIKYGYENHIFEIIEECEIEKLNERERFWQEHYEVLGENGLNCVYQGFGDISGKLSTITKMRLSKSLKGKAPWNKGVKTGKSSAVAKIVLDLSTGIFYNSCTEASKTYNIKRTTLNAMLVGQNPNNTELIYV